MTPDARARLGGAWSGDVPRLQSNRLAVFYFAPGGTRKGNIIIQYSKVFKCAIGGIEIILRLTENYAFVQSGILPVSKLGNYDIYTSLECLFHDLSGFIVKNHLL